MALLQNITTIFIPWRNCPCRDLNANVHHYNAETFWGLLRLGRCTFHYHLSPGTHVSLDRQYIFHMGKGLDYEDICMYIYINKLKAVVWDSLEMHVFSYHKSFRVFTVGGSDAHRHFSQCLGSALSTSLNQLWPNIHKMRAITSWPMYTVQAVNYGYTPLKPALYVAYKKYANNTLLPSDATRRHKSGSTFAQVMAGCLAASNHYMKKCWPHHQQGHVGFTWG